MRGVVHTDSHFLQFQTEFFHGKQNAISYEFDATSLTTRRKNNRVYPCDLGLRVPKKICRLRH